MPFFPYDHHPLRCCKVLPSLACCFYLLKTDQVGLPWWSHGWLQDSTAGGKGFHPCSGTKILQVLTCSQKTDLFFSPSPPSGCTYPFIIQIFTQEFLVTVRVSFICQFRKLQLLIIQTHTKVCFGGGIKNLSSVDFKVIIQDNLSKPHSIYLWASFNQLKRLHTGPKSSLKKF